MFKIPRKADAHERADDDRARAALIAIDVRAHLTHFTLNYKFWLNLAFGGLGAYLWWLSRKHPMNHDHAYHDHGAHDHAGHDAHQPG